MARIAGLPLRTPISTKAPLIDSDRMNSPASKCEQSLKRRPPVILRNSASRGSRNGLLRWSGYAARAVSRSPMSVARAVHLNREFVPPTDRKFPELVSVERDVVVLVQPFLRAGFASQESPRQSPQPPEAADSVFVLELRKAPVRAGPADREVPLESVVPVALPRYDPIQQFVKQRSDDGKHCAQESEATLENIDRGPCRWHERNRVGTVHDAVDRGPKVVHQTAVPDSRGSERVAGGERISRDVPSRQGGERPAERVSRDVQGDAGEFLEVRADLWLDRKERLVEAAMHTPNELWALLTSLADRVFGEFEVRHPVLDLLRTAEADDCHVVAARCAVSSDESLRVRGCIEQHALEINPPDVENPTERIVPIAVGVSKGGLECLQAIGDLAWIAETGKFLRKVDQRGVVFLVESRIGQFGENRHEPGGAVAVSGTTHRGLAGRDALEVSLQVW